MRIALAFLQYLYCRQKADGDSCDECPSCNKIKKLIHPDVHFVFPVNSGLSVEYMAQWRKLLLENPYFTERDLSEALETEGKTSMIKVEETKAILDILSLSALERGYRSVVVYLPEKMNKEAANRLLKAIEEPPAMTQFVLVTHAPENVITTIRSRCQVIRVVGNGGVSSLAGGEEEMELLRPLMESLLAKDLPSALVAGDAISALPSREKAKSFCKFAAGVLREMFLVQQNLESLSDAPEEFISDIRRWSSKARRTFPRQALAALSRSQTLIDRNVNIKIICTVLVDALFMAI